MQYKIRLEEGKKVLGYKRLVASHCFSSRGGTIYFNLIEQRLRDWKGPDEQRSNLLKSFKQRAEAGRLAEDIGAHVE